MGALMQVRLLADLCDHHIEIVSPAAMPTMKPLL